MNFKIKPIRKRTFNLKTLVPIEKYKHSLKNFHFHKPYTTLLFSGLLFGIIATIVILVTATIIFNNTSVSDILRPLSKKVKVDGANHTNFLLLGTGTEEHEGSDLTDTMMVASLDHDEKYVSLISIPRDLYAITELGNMRVNQIYEAGIEKEMPEKGMETLRKTIEKITGLQIHYYAKINFDGFTEAISAMGGIDLLIDETIVDYTYPKGETHGTETFVLEKGLQHLNGETALKYARTRKCNICFDGDTGRAKRQQNVINAIKEKAISSNTLFSAGKIKKILEIIQQNFKTDLSIREILDLAGEAEDFPKENIASWVIHDDPGQEGGFLYVPERRYYGGAFVFVPRTSPMGIKDENPYYEINDFIKLVAKNPALMKKKLPITILNGTKYPNLASLTEQYLVRYGGNPIKVGNAKERNLMETKIFYSDPESEKLAELFGTMFPGKPEEIPLDIKTYYETDLVIILGQDFASWYDANTVRFY